MKLPYPKIKPNAHVIIRVAAGLSINGSEQTETWEGPAIFNEHHKWVQSDEGKRVEGEGKVYLFRDLLSNIPQLTGTVVIRGVTYTFSGSRFYNPDGTVHHVELRLK